MIKIVFFIVITEMMVNVRRLQQKKDVPLVVIVPLEKYLQMATIYLFVLIIVVLKQ